MAEHGAGSQLVRGRQASGNHDEVRLVSLPEIERKLSTVKGFARVETFQQLMESVAPDDPLRRHTHVCFEQPLQCAHT